jgi:esterase/lipase superfamily enzyme
MASSLQPHKHEYGVMTVLFATSRELASQPGQPAFGAKRAAQITYGSCDVSIPREHRMGVLESPSIWRFEFRPDPNEHIVLLGTKIEDRDRFFADLVARAAKDGKRSTFLFVHGYNVSFEDAARRTAQIAYDLGFKGAPVFYSWPSEGKEAAYMADEQAVEWAESGLRRFLSDYLNTRGVDNVYVIAHSMGNRALTRALADVLKSQPALSSKIGEVILAAPDIDADVFRDEIAPRMTEWKRPITLYASSKDRALEASKFVHRYPRAGEAGPAIVVVPGVETIDATNRSTDLIDHSYFGDNDSILADMFYMFRGRAAKDRFGLIPMQVPAGDYWMFVK